MKQQSKNISTIYPRDIRALSALASCGHVSHKQLQEILRDKRIQSYCKAGLVNKSVYSRPDDKSGACTYYRLSEKGRRLCRDILHKSSLYNAQSPNHDLALAERYFSISESERESWKTESQVRDLIQEHINQLQIQGSTEHAQELLNQLHEGQFSMPDAIYTNENGVTIAFEVTTNNYGQSDLDAKLETAAELGAEIEFLRV